jgi:hypothetical protein
MRFQALEQYMGKGLRVVAIGGVLALLAVPAAVCASELKPVKTVLELFTSQGCSSCPKADKLLGEYAADKRFIALSLAVDYWDYLGWRDTLALHAHSLRQKGYAIHRGDRNVYTPQIVLNGKTEAIGNNRQEIEKAVADIERKVPLALPVSLKRNDNSIEIEVGAGGGPVASVWLLAVLQKAPVLIERGENRGKTITYHNVVRGWIKIAEWSGQSVKRTHSIAELGQNGADAAVVVVQSGSPEAPGVIRGAAMLALY